MAAKTVEPQRGGWFSKLLGRGMLSSRRRLAVEVAFPADFLATLERLRLVALRALGGGLREGHRLGAYKGGQLEFHGHRSYTPGDELRYVDWNSYARLGRPYVKEFAREEAGVLHLLLDATPSMSLGVPSKWTFARRLSALFAHVALSSKDVARLHVFRAVGGVEQFPLRGAKAGTRGYLAFLDAARLEAGARDEGRGTRGVLDGAVSAFLRGGPARGRVIVLSDFWQEEQEIVTAVSRLSAAGHDVAGLHVLAPEELEPQVEGELLARSVEEDGDVELSAGGDFAAHYARELEAHCGAVENALRRRGGNYLRASSDTSIERVLITALRQRRWVM